ncbi:Pentatricopeptide repeat-containing protein At5g02860 [Durusdinium trenchii]
MFLEMPEKQLAVDLRALNGVLSACEEGGAWPWAIQLMADAVPELLPDVPCLRKALSSCRKGCAWRWALVLLDDFEGFGFLVDATTLRQAIAACEGAGREARDAKVALERRRKRQEVAHDARWPIQKKPVKTEVSERRTMKQEAMKKLSMGTTSGPEAMGYISLLRANFKLSCKEYTMLISFLSTRTLWKSALTLFSEMPEREAIPDQTAYTTAIAACRLAKRWTHALELYAKMCDELMPPTISTLNALISVCGQSERWREALLVFEEIAGFSLRPDGVTLKATLEAATEGRQWPLALRLLRATPQPEAYHFNQALRACERSSCWRESLQLLKDIRDSNLAPSLQQYHFGISAVSAASYWSLALALLAEAEQSGQRARPESVEAVLNACLVARQSAFAWQLLPKGLERGSIVSATEMVASLYQTPWQETLEQLAACPSSWLAGTFRPALRASRAPGASTLAKKLDDPWLPLVLTFISWLTFSLTMLLFAFGEEIGHTIWAVWLSALLLAIFVLSMAWARRMPGQMLLGYFLLAALLLAVPFGESVAESFMDEFFRLRGGAAYRLKASTAGASVLDATVLHFEKGDFVNASKSIGFKKAGHLYCVAPLLSRRNQENVSFWLSGMDCCDHRGGFYCHSAQEPNARSGIVLADRDGTFVKAARMAQSVHQLPVLKKYEILVLGWVPQPELYLQHLWASAVTYISIASGSWLLLSCCLAPCASRSRRYGRPF